MDLLRKNDSWLVLIYIYYPFHEGNNDPQFLTHFSFGREVLGKHPGRHQRPSRRPRLHGRGGLPAIRRHDSRPDEAVGRVDRQEQLPLGGLQE